MHNFVNLLHTNKICKFAGCAIAYHRNINKMTYYRTT